MKTIPVTPNVLDNLSKALANAPILHGLDPAVVAQVAAQAVLIQAEAGETLTREGDPADTFYVLLEGRASALIRRDAKRGDEEVGVLVPGDSFGDVAMLVKQPFGATVKATSGVVAARFPSAIFDAMAAQVPGFGIAVARSLGRRLQQALHAVPFPEHPGDAPPPPADTIRLLPPAFVAHQRVLPLKLEEGMLTLGFVEAPTPAVLESVRQFAPGMTIRPVRISPAFFEAALKACETPAAATPAIEGGTVVMNDLLATMVREGASDLHLSAGQRPKWRVDGLIREVPCAPVLGPETVLELLAPLVDERFTHEYRDQNDADFAYRHPSGERFRVNMFRDVSGTGAVLRHVPSRIPTLESLGMPDVVRTFCSLPKGLVLVTGPTGSGKSTTLAAMVDLINSTRDEHILTLEDPVEFVHPGKRAHVNQREIGTHSSSFSRALRAALREDPDIVLVGEMRDLETVNLALETANTGHLVLATLHTSTAMLTISRIVGMFPADQQDQIRTTLADVLRGVICQNLCRRVGGGRVAALEIMVVNAAISNLIREGKMSQVPSIMQTGKAAGNVLLNESLATLVKSGKVEAAEALAKAVDKADLAKHINVSVPA